MSKKFSTLFISLIAAIIFLSPMNAEIFAQVSNMEITLELSFGKRTGIYTGNTENGIPHGQGQFETINSENEAWYYEGDFVNGRFQGEGIIVFESGSIYEGTFVDDELFNGRYRIGESGRWNTVKDGKSSSINWALILLILILTGAGIVVFWIVKNVKANIEETAAKKEVGTFPQGPFWTPSDSKSTISALIIGGVFIIGFPIVSVAVFPNMSMSGFIIIPFVFIAIISVAIFVPAFRNLSRFKQAPEQTSQVKVTRIVRSANGSRDVEDCFVCRFPDGSEKVLIEDYTLKKHYDSIRKNDSGKLTYKEYKRNLYIIGFEKDPSDNEVETTAKNSKAKTALVVLLVVVLTAITGAFAVASVFVEPFGVIMDWLGVAMSIIVIIFAVGFAVGVMVVILKTSVQPEQKAQVKVMEITRDAQNVYVTFEFPDKSRKEFRLPDVSLISTFQDKDTGILTFKEYKNSKTHYSKEFISFEKYLS